MSTNLDFKVILEQFLNLTKNPENYLSVQSETVNNIKTFLKESYDSTKREERKNKKSKALSEMIVGDFDLEQIWQQLNLQNNDVLANFLKNICNLAVKKVKFPELSDNDNQENADRTKENTNVQNNVADDRSDADISNDEIADDEIYSEDEKEPEFSKKTAKTKSSLVDDDFFKLNEMESFLQSEENKEDKKDSEEESVDYFESGDEENDLDNEPVNPKYEEFFENNDRSAKRKRNNDFDDLMEVENEDVKSRLELRKEKLSKKIEQIEENALREKVWQLKGEVTADSRPQNSLLEEIVEFDLTSRPAPVITEETTLKLEDIIRQRIIDKSFDSVERKEKPERSILEYKKKLVLDQEKSKESLAQIYEKEYLQQKDALQEDAIDENSEVEPELHKEIKTMMSFLLMQLDALSNFHFTPKRASVELKVVNNLPTTSMEEVAPIATSENALLAPEEVRPKLRGDLVGKTERSVTDKKRERRKKKQKQREHAKVIKKKLSSKIGVGNKYSKENANDLLKQVTKSENTTILDGPKQIKVKSSKSFFTQLEETVKTGVVREKKRNKIGLNAKSVKL